MKRIRKFIQLGWPDQWLLIQTFLLLGLITLGLRLLPFLTLQQLLNKLANRHDASLSAPRRSASHIVWALQVASCWTPHAPCLPQALAGYFLLTRNGHAADLHMGVARNADGKFEAHAWVKSDQGIVIGRLSDLDRYVSFSPVERNG